MYKKNNYFVNKTLFNKKIKYGFFSKIGGLSSKNFFSLNCSLSSGDKKNLVKKNIDIAKKKLFLSDHKLKILDQTHSNKVIIINKNNLKESIKADGSITSEKNIALAILTADCAPIFIYDSDSNFICCLHAGWKGCLKNIVKEAFLKIKKIQKNPNKLNAIIGPCLARKNFEVDRKFKDIFLKKNHKYKIFFSRILKSNKYLFDMRGIIKMQLRDCSIKKISNIKIDTYANHQFFFSHRRSFHQNNLPTGRMINIIAFNSFK
jgi:YfiH family protein